MTDESHSGNDAPLPIAMPIAVAGIPSDGCKGVIEPDASQCAELADALGVLAIERFEFSYDLSNLGRGRFRLTGSLTSLLQQECVVTLEPLATKIDETFTLELWPAKDVAMAEKFDHEDGRSIALDGPEPLEGDFIDVGQLAYEHLASIIDAYPRKKGTKFEWVTDDDNADKPFAALGELLNKKRK